MFHNFTYRFDLIRNGFGVLRCLFIKLLYVNRVSFNGLFVVERGGIISAKKNGRINFKGKTRLFEYAELRAIGQIEIGHNFYINKYSRVISHDRIHIGNNVTIAQFVTILDHDHNFILKENKLEIKGYTTAPISIGNNVWIADKVTVLKGVKIGNNVVVAANAVINKDVPDNCVVAGIPFKIIRRLDE